MVFHSYVLYGETMMTIKNIIFDMGNVLLEWNARKNIEQVESAPQRADILQQEIFTSGVWGSGIKIGNF